LVIDVDSALDCKELIERIRQTLSAKGYLLSGIQEIPKPFPSSDTAVFEGLCRAVLTRQAQWASIERILPALKTSLLGYSINGIAALTDGQIRAIAVQYKNKVKARFFEQEMFAIRDNARKLQGIGAIRTFIKDYLSASAYDASSKCYIHPTDDDLIRCFADPSGKFKLDAVGLAICCEFFNNIGIDEFKPDVHTISFLNRINLNRRKVRVSRMSPDIRAIGIRIAETLQKPRKFVDSHIWVFCAEHEGEICTEDDPQCHSCMLHTQEPQLCLGFPSRMQIINDPMGTARRLKECNSTWKDASRKMPKAGLTPATVQNAVMSVY
jgi:hypothetical protein